MRIAGQVKMGYYPTPLRVVELIRTMLRFGDLPETLEGKIEKISDRITELKESLTPSNGEATYAQWRKLYFLLADNAPVDTRCEVLNTVTDIKATSALIEKWLKPAVSEKDAPSNVRHQAA